MGVRVPEEVKVIGFDNIPLSQLVDPPLTTIAQPIKELGMNAAELLLRKIADPSAPNQQVVMQCSMVERESSG
jgi:DNA-binding LacI/PurR family transcriptional regulator